MYTAVVIRCLGTRVLVRFCDLHRVPGGSSSLMFGKYPTLQSFAHVSRFHILTNVTEMFASLLFE